MTAATSPGPATPNGTDPVLARRALARRWATFGKRVGYSAVLISITAFVTAALTNFPRALVVPVIGGLVVFSITFPPAEILGYAIRAAEREERERQGP